MTTKNKCKCGEHGKKHHKDMTPAESFEHLKNCLDDTIERLQCLRDSVENLKP